MIPRSEHPKPQFRRDGWMNLNGEWDFCFDNGRSGEARKIYDSPAAFDRKIVVPFCVQSRLSGIENKDFVYGVWYKRTVILTPVQAAGRTVLHVGAADYRTAAYINGQKAGVHKGGYVSFSFDITNYVHAGENTVVIYCEDDERDPMIPVGKQSREYYSHGCDYTRTTGIWQTVWLEFTPKEYIRSFRIIPDAASQSVQISAVLAGRGDLRVLALYEGREMAATELNDVTGTVSFSLTLTESHLWEIGKGRLYDLELVFKDDAVHSYFGLRSVAIDGYKFLLNGRSVFQRLVLDQGFYPDGIYTAPSDEALHGDILLSKKLGFNGARLHQKVFEERFLYHCDKEGYMVWGEYPNWGLDHTVPESIYGILPEWLEELERDFNHPSIIGWCPFNETWNIGGREQYNPLLSAIYRTTKTVDPTRPCIDTSGNYHVETDVFDVHDYEQDPAVLSETQRLLTEEDVLRNHCSNRQEYVPGMPVFISEYGGIKWSREADSGTSWGYGNTPQTEEAYKARYKGLTDAILDNPKVFGFCYTQLTDIEQEQNGCYYYDRTPKFDAEFYYAVNSRKAVIEEEGADAK